MRSLIFLFSIFASTALVVDAKDLSFLDHDDQRDLLTFGVNARCEQRLEKCEAGAGGLPLPVASWLDALSGIPSDGTLEKIFTDAGEADSSSALAHLDTLKPSTTSKALIEINRELSEITIDETDLETQQEEVFGPIIQQILLLLGNVSFSWIPVILRIIIFAIKLFIAIQGGPVTLVIFLLQFAIRQLIGFTREAATFAMFPAADLSCFSALLDCTYRNFMMEAGPILMALSASAFSGGSETP